MSSTSIDEDYILTGYTMEGGNVKLVREKKTDTVYSLKTIKYDQKKFDEISKMRTFNHPNIVKIYDVIYDNKLIHIITDYICMGNIWERCHNDIATEKLCSNYIRQLCEAIKYLHDMGIIYGNLHPGKVLIDQYDNVLLNLMLPSHDDKNYMAPEGNYSNKSDIWSIGLLTYFISYNDLSLRFKEENNKNDFIKSLTTLNPEDRYDINKALSHPWLQNTPRDDGSNIIRFNDSLDKKMFINVFLDIINNERKDWLKSVNNLNIHISLMGKTDLHLYTIEVHENEIIIKNEEDCEDDDDTSRVNSDIFNIVFQALTMV